MLIIQSSSLSASSVLSTKHEFQTPPVALCTIGINLGVEVAEIVYIGSDEYGDRPKFVDNWRLQKN